MDYTASGIANSFQYELVGVFAPHQHIGWYTSVIDGRLTRSWSAQYRESLALSIDGEPLPLGCLLRVWHTAELDGESEQTCLGTFMQVSSSLSYDSGRYYGSYQLQSCLLRHGTDKRGNNRNIPTGTNIASLFNSIVTNSGGDPVVDSGVSTSKTFGATHVWEFGESALEELNRCANALGAMVHVSPMGETVLKPYIVPASRPMAWSLTADNVIPGVAQGAPDIVNVVQVKYTPQGSQNAQFASAYLADGQPWSRGTIGRHSAATYSINELTKSTVQAQANYLLAQAVTGANTWTVTMPYMPLETGAKGTLIYQDNDGDDGVSVVAVIDTMEIDLDTGMLMQVKVSEVANG